MISVQDGVPAGSLGELSGFGQAFYSSLTGRADTLFELTDAALCADGPITSLVELSMAAEHRRGHGALYDSLSNGRIDIDRLSKVVASQLIPRCTDGRIVLAIDISNWLRPDAATSPDRLFCHTYGRGKGQAQMIPGWPYSFIAALESGRTSWTAILDAQRLGPYDEDTAVASAQLRAVVERLIAAGHWNDGDPHIWIVGDSGYDGPRLAFELADLPVQVLVRVRSDRVMALPAPPRAKGALGRGKRHGAEMKFKDPATWPEPTHATTSRTSRYGTALAWSWNRLHPKLTHRGVWAEHHGDVPIIEGTVIGVAGRSPPRRRRAETVVAVVLRHRHRRRRSGRVVADVPAPLRSRTHVQIFEANPRPDQAPYPNPSGGRPVDLADRRRPHPTPTGPPPRRRPTPSLGEITHNTRAAHPGPRPAGVSQHPTDNHPARQRAETLHTRSRPSTRITKHPPSPPTRPRKTPTNSDNRQGRTEASSLKLKISERMTSTILDDGICPVPAKLGHCQ